MGILYYGSLAIAALWFAYDLKRLATGCPKTAFRVFLQNHWVGVIILAGIILDKAC